MEKYVVYLNDGYNYPEDVFSADTLEECIDWINEDLKSRTPVDHECDDFDEMLRYFRIFLYQVCKGDYIVDVNGAFEYNESLYISDYYYIEL